MAAGTHISDGGVREDEPPGGQSPRQDLVDNEADVLGGPQRNSISALSLDAEQPPASKVRSIRSSLSLFGDASLFSKESPPRESGPIPTADSRQQQRRPSHRFLPWSFTGNVPASKHAEKLARRRLRSSQCSAQSLSTGGSEKKPASLNPAEGIQRSRSGSLDTSDSVWVKQYLGQELAGLDIKLKKLTRKVDECLTGIADVQRLQQVKARPGGGAHSSKEPQAAALAEVGSQAAARVPENVRVPQSQWKRGAVHSMLAQPQHDSDEDDQAEIGLGDDSDQEEESYQRELQEDDEEHENDVSEETIVKNPNPGRTSMLLYSASRLASCDTDDTAEVLPDWAGSVGKTTRQSKMSLQSSENQSGGAHRSSRRSSASMTSSIIDSSTLRNQMALLVMKRSFATESIWQFLEEPQPNSLGAIFAQMTPYIILASVGLTLWQTTHWTVLEDQPLLLLELSFDFLFSLEVVLRFWACPDRWHFFHVTYNWIDVSAALPALFVRTFAVLGYIEGIGVAKLDQLGHDMLLCFVPVLRLLKLLRRFEKFHLLLSAFKIACEALPVLLFTLSVIVLFFSSLIYLAEPRENIRSLPQAMWLTIVTIATVGYGDSVPISHAGHIIVAALIGASALYMAIPLGIVGKAFGDVWEDRNRLLLLQTFRTRLRQRGYRAQDVPQLFHVFDRDKDGEMSFGEFHNMLLEIRVGIDEQSVQNLFCYLDNDRSGKIGDDEFVRSVFPKDYERIYGVVSINQEMIRISKLSDQEPPVEEGQHAHGAAPLHHLDNLDPVETPRSARS